MRSVKLLIAAAFSFCIASCTNNRNSNSNNIDSTSLSTNPAMQGVSDSGIDSENGMRSSDSADIMTSPTDSPRRAGTSAGSGSGSASDSLHR